MESEPSSPSETKAADGPSRLHQLLRVQSCLCVRAVCLSNDGRASSPLCSLQARRAQLENKQKKERKQGAAAHPHRVSRFSLRLRDACPCCRVASSRRRRPHSLLGVGPLGHAGGVPRAWVRVGHGAPGPRPVVHVPCPRYSATDTRAFYHGLPPRPRLCCTHRVHCGPLVHLLRRRRGPRRQSHAVIPLPECRRRPRCSSPAPIIIIIIILTLTLCSLLASPLPPARGRCRWEKRRRGRRCRWPRRATDLQR